MPASWTSPATSMPSTLPSHLFSVLLLLLLSRPSWPQSLRGPETSRRLQQAPPPPLPPLMEERDGGGGSSDRAPLVLTDTEYAMFEAINTYRTDKSLPEVCINRRLQAAARDTVDRALECDDHANNVNRLCDGSTAEDRVSEAGYPLNETYFQALVMYMGGCKQGLEGCGRKAIKNWYGGGSTQNTLLDPDVVHLGVSGAQSTQGTSWFYSLFYGSASTQKCVHVKPDTPPEDQGDGANGPHQRRRQLLMALEE